MSFLKQHKAPENTIKVNSYAAEYMVDEVFMKNLEQASPLLLLNDTYILVEINFFGKTTMLKSACFNLCQKRHYSNIGASRTLSSDQRHL